MFRDQSRELTRADYDRLIATAWERGQNRLALLMETICATGIRVSEVRYITAETAKAGRAEIALKGKIRVILIPGKLCRKLLKYAKKKQNRFRRDFSHRKRQKPFTAADMGGDETAMQICGCGAVQSISSQPASLFCRGLLPGLQGHCPSCGPAGTLQRGDHPYLPDILWSRARAAARASGACRIARRGEINIPSNNIKAGLLRRVAKSIFSIEKHCSFLHIFFKLYHIQYGNSRNFLN